MRGSGDWDCWEHTEGNYTGQEWQISEMTEVVNDWKNSKKGRNVQNYKSSHCDTKTIRF